MWAFLWIKVGSWGFTVLNHQCEYLWVWNFHQMLNNSLSSMIALAFETQGTITSMVMTPYSNAKKKKNLNLPGPSESKCLNGVSQIRYSGKFLALNGKLLMSSLWVPTCASWQHFSPHQWNLFAKLIFVYDCGKFGFQQIWSRNVQRWD